jgi:hypothetical protein
MRRYTGQRALYEAWSLSRSKPKRHGLLERLRPQLEKLQAVANAKLKAVAPPRSPGTQMPEPAFEEPRPEVAAKPARVETPKVDVSDRISKRESVRSEKPKVKAPIVQSAPRSEVRQREAEAAKVEVEKPEAPKVEAPKIELPEVETPEVTAVKAEPPTVEPEEIESLEIEIEEPKPVLRSPVVVPETPKAAPREVPQILRRFASAASRRPIERPVLSPKKDRWAGFRLARIVDRLKAIRTQLAERAVSSRDAKARLTGSLRPRAFQVNDSRVEVSVPVVYAILIALAAVIVVLAAFKIGRMPAGGHEPQNGSPSRVTIAEKNPVGSSVGAQGNNRIVIAQHTDRVQLEPLIDYFKENGIVTGTVTFGLLREYLTKKGLSTSAVPKGEGYLLMTVSLYNNPDTPGTDGYAVKQKIIELGAKYRAPEGATKFAPDSFRGAYGLKVQ